MEKINRIRINSLSIKNYKAIDELELSFPKPQMEDDFDVMVIGSKNGVGKTSILECISLLFSSLFGDLTTSFLQMEAEGQLENLIRSGAPEAFLEGEFEVNGNTYDISICLNKESGPIIAHRHYSSTEPLNRLIEDYQVRDYEQFKHPELLINSTLGRNNNPFIIPPFFSYFHSYRKIDENNPDLKFLVTENSGISEEKKSRKASTINLFKQDILKLMMTRGGLFEGVETTSSNESLDTLNSLMEDYAYGKITGLKPTSDNSFDFRVTPLNQGVSFSLDGLSSGQKEIISTLFLIWKNSRNFNGIVLIDEPELHLNAEWHRSFFNKLEELAPHNQYIIATHSEAIFSSVSKEQCILLKKD